VGTAIELRYNPFDLAQVQVYREGAFYAVLRASKLSRKQLIDVPQERKTTRFSPEAAEYFKRIREKAAELQKQRAEELRYADLSEKERKE
jgi:hypothetical protein